MSDGFAAQRVADLEKAVSDAHRLAVDLQVRYCNVAHRKVSGFTVYTTLNSLTWRLAKVLPKKGEKTPPPTVRVYRNEYVTTQCASEGFAFFTDKAEANDAAKAFKSERRGDEPEVRKDHIDVPLTAEGVLRLLESWATHPDTGEPP